MEARRVFQLRCLWSLSCFSQQKEDCSCTLSLEHRRVYVQSELSDELYEKAGPSEPSVTSHSFPGRPGFCEWETWDQEVDMSSPPFPLLPLFGILLYSKSLAFASSTACVSGQNVSEGGHYKSSITKPCALMNAEAMALL